jgi:uncharacterized protein YndB with AHSA1/START domain
MTFLIVVLIIILLPFVLALFAGDDFSIERSITIDHPVHGVFNYIRFLGNGEEYNKWMMADPSMKKEQRGADGSVGSVYAWDSTDKKVGQGEQEIIALSENKRIDYEIRFMRPFKGVSGSALETTPLSGDQTQVKWIFSGKKNYFMKVIHIALNLEKALGKDLAISLGSLKNRLEKNA